MIFRRCSLPLIFISLIGHLCLSLGEETEGLEASNSTTIEAAAEGEEDSQPYFFVPDVEFVTVTTRYGQIKGFREYSSKGKPFYSFLGIPFAKPPIGPLRFKDPEFPENWEGVRDGTGEPPMCTQIDLHHFTTSHDPPVYGEEDCLYVNVYTSQPTMDRADLPVLVYIHGGQFISGSAKDYKPYDLLNEDVVLVVMQYRLGVLGFMSTEDMVMPGNLGLKDQTKAIHWLHRNIEFFGGSPIMVTLFGSDAGAASVHFQSLTHHTIGLFTRGIMQSGTALCPWAMGGVHKDAAHYIGHQMECKPAAPAEKSDEKDEQTTGEVHSENPEEVADRTTSEETEKISNDEREASVIDKEAEPKTEAEEKTASDVESPETESTETSEEKKEEKSEEESTEEEKLLSSEELLECLVDVDAKNLTKLALKLFMWSSMPLIFGPYADGTYIPDTPEYLLREARHKRLDLIIGINKEDGSVVTNSLYASEGRRMSLTHHFQIVGPISLEFTDDDIAPVNMSIKAYDHYLKSLKVDAQNADNLTRLYTDRHFGVCSDLTALMHAKNNVQRKKKVFFYELQHRGDRSTGDSFKLAVGKQWIAHGDELFYLFPMTESGNATRSDDDSKLSDYMTKLWANFAANGNPTPDESLGFTWEPFTPTERRHLSLLPTPTMEDDNREDVREFWTSLPTRQNIMFFKDKFIKPTEETSLNEDDVEGSESVTEDVEGDEQTEKEETTNSPIKEEL